MTPGAAYPCASVGLVVIMLIVTMWVALATLDGDDGDGMA